MTIWKLDDPAIGQLRRLPETGMGFQWVTGRVAGRPAALLVFNCELAFDLSAVHLEAALEPAAILANGSRVMNVLRRAEPAQTSLSAPSPTDFLLVDTRLGAPDRPAPLAAEAARIAQTSGLTKKTELLERRRFHRYSAYYPDRRIDPATGDLLPGSYAVPDAEVAFIPTGFAAVGRLALPNIDPASNHYVIEASTGTVAEFGSVAPAFGQAGGGVEVFFPRGATNIRQLPAGPLRIPDE